ncbi:MAG: AMP-binding protein [Acetobacteraceae bacterium]
MPGIPAFPLLLRDQDDVLFGSAEHAVTGRMFLHAAHRLAADLPDGAWIVNLCRDRCHFALVFAAAVLRGQVSLLVSDRSSYRLRALADEFPGTVSVSDDPSVESPLRHHVVSPAWGAPAGDLPIPSIPAERIVAIVFTSGSTGEPVAHRKSWGALAMRNLAAGTRFDLTPTHPTSIVGTVPAQHMYGFETTVLLPLHVAASSWRGTVFYPVDMRRALDAVPAPRLLVTTPLQIRAMLQTRLALPPVAAIVSATAPLDAAMAAAAERRWDTRVLEIFGATEVGSIASRRTVAGDAWNIYPGVHLNGTAEETLVVAPFAAPTALSDVIERLDDDHFRLLGRRTDLIKLGGRRASLSGLNRILTGIEGVTDGVFIPPDGPDDRPIARMLAFVVAPARTPDAILAALRERIDPAFLPRRVIAVDTLPRDEVGKLAHHALAALRARLQDA